MYPYPPPPPPWFPSAAERHVRNNVVLLLVLAFLHFCGIGSVALNVAAFVRTHHDLAHPSPNAIGEMTAYACTAVWALGGVVWAPINAYGLSKRRPWARISSLLYWGFQIASCCCFPFGAYGVWAMLRADVKEMFSARG